MKHTFLGLGILLGCAATYYIKLDACYGHTWVFDVEGPSCHQVTATGIQPVGSVEDCRNQCEVAHHRSSGASRKLAEGVSANSVAICGGAGGATLRLNDRCYCPDPSCGVMCNNTVVNCGTQIGETLCVCGTVIGTVTVPPAPPAYQQSSNLPRGGYSSTGRRRS